MDLQSGPRFCFGVQAESLGSRVQSLLWGDHAVPNVAKLADLSGFSLSSGKGWPVCKSSILTVYTQLIPLPCICGWSQGHGDIDMVYPLNYATSIC